jgi:hypothetical protein
MGADAADYDRSGRPHLLVGNFSNQMLGLYHNEGTGLFVDEAPRSNVGRVSLLYLTFGAFFFDYDLDGWLDLFSANGHIEEEIGRVQPKVSYRQSPLLFRNLAGRKFEHVPFDKPMVARGAAYGDYDGDGDLDVLVTTNHGPAYLFRNDAAHGRHWINVKLVGTKSNRDGIGAAVRIESASGKQWQMVRSGSSYCSQSELALTFGLDGDDAVKTIEVAWPTGAVERFQNAPANRRIVLTEGRLGWTMR